jgi:alcohol dehydrogenase (cytochrome c)
MKTLASGACVLLLLGAGAWAQTLDDLKKDGNGGSTDNILTYGMGYHQQRYSPLEQINKQTVKRLVPVWNLSLDNNWGEQAQPITYNGVMYITNARATVAIDVATGKADLETDPRLAAGDPARRLLRRLQQGRGDLQRQGLSHHARCPRGRL